MLNDHQSGSHMHHIQWIEESIFELPSQITDTLYVGVHIFSSSIH